MFRCPRCCAELNPITAVAICPICLAEHRVRSPLQFEIGWHGGRTDPSDRRAALRTGAARKRLPERRQDRAPRSPV